MSEEYRKSNLLYGHLLAMSAAPPPKQCATKWLIALSCQKNVEAGILSSGRNSYKVSCCLQVVGGFNFRNEGMKLGHTASILMTGGQPNYVNTFIRINAQLP